MWKQMSPFTPIEAAQTVHFYTFDNMDEFGFIMILHEQQLIQLSSI